MDDSPKLPEKYKIIFVLMAGIMVLSLGIGIVGPLVYDALDGGDDGGGNSLEIDASVGDSFRATAEANPSDPLAAAAYANYLANTGELTAAIPWYEKAISLAPDDATLRLDFARSLSSGDLHGDAELQFNRAIELQPENPEAHYYLGELYYAMSPQRTVDAINEYEETIALAPNHSSPSERRSDLWSSVSRRRQRARCRMPDQERIAAMSETQTTISPELLALLVCPVDHAELELHRRHAGVQQMRAGLSDCGRHSEHGGRRVDDRTDVRSRGILSHDRTTSRCLQSSSRSRDARSNRFSAPAK